MHAGVRKKDESLIMQPILSWKAYPLHLSSGTINVAMHFWRRESTDFRNTGGDERPIS